MYDILGSCGICFNLNLFKFNFSNIATVSPYHLFWFNSSNTTNPPLEILGRKFSSATLVGSYKSKSKYNKETKICLLFFKYCGIVLIASPFINSILLI